EMSKDSPSSKRVSSRLADPMSRRSSAPSGIGTPPTSASLSALRRQPTIDPAYRRTSSMAFEIFLSSSTMVFHRYQWVSVVEYAQQLDQAMDDVQRQRGEVVKR